MRATRRTSLPRSFAVLAGAIAWTLLSAYAFADDPVTVYGQSQDDGSTIIYASSTHIIPVYVSVNIPQLVNMRTDVDLPYGVELSPGDTGVKLFTLTPTQTTGRIGYSISYTFARGNPLTAHRDESFHYLFPFGNGEKYHLSQGFHGAFSHSGENEYAVDFEMPEGTPVYAARAGLVAEVKEDSRVGGTSQSYANDANYILVMHDDGSFANYVHLRYGGAIVEPGDRVEEAQLIGYSGNTGRSSGPHLHFDVRLPQTDGHMQSIPFTFRAPDGSAMVPETGRFYYSHQPGGADFVETYGSNITPADYADYAVPYTETAKPNVRLEQIDLTFVLFLQNGLDHDVDLLLTLQLRGLESANGLRIEKVVPAQTEVFATVLQPIPSAPAIQYGYTLQARQ